jgi:Tol biopolymer transport system component
MHYHPAPSPDSKWLLYGSKRDGVLQLYVMRLSDKKEWRITDLAKRRAAMWPQWQPRAVPKAPPTSRRRPCTTSAAKG